MLNTKDENINKLETQIAQIQNTTPHNQPVQQVVQVTTPPKTRSANLDHASQIMQKYDLALSNFNSRNYNAVITGLTDLLEKNPNHQRSSNFVYWIGESFFALKNYIEAQKFFQTVSTYKNSPKLDYALYMEGRCLYNLGDNNKAALKFEELLKKHPSSSLTGKATNYLQKIQRVIS